MALWDELPGRAVTAQEIAAELPAGDEDDDDSLVAVWVPQGALERSVAAMDGRTMYDHKIESFILERPKAYYAVDLETNAPVSCAPKSDGSEISDEARGLTWSLIDRVKHEYFEDLSAASKSKVKILVDLSEFLLKDSSDEWTLAAAAGYGEKYARVGPEGNVFRGMADTKHFTEPRDLNDLLALVPDPRNIYGDIRILPEEHNPSELRERLRDAGTSMPSGSVSHTGPGTRHGSPTEDGLRGSPEYSPKAKAKETGTKLPDEFSDGNAYGPPVDFDHSVFSSENLPSGTDSDDGGVYEGDDLREIELSNGSTIELPKLTDREMVEAAANYGHSPESMSDSLDALRYAMEGMAANMYAPSPSGFSINVPNDLKEQILGAAYGPVDSDGDDDE